MDSGWCIFAETCRRDFDQCTFKSELVAECGGNDDIAWATFFHLKEFSLEWLHREVPALDHQVPFQLIAAGQADRVRDCLWCMPC